MASVLLKFYTSHAKAHLCISDRRRTLVIDAPVTSWHALWHDSIHPIRQELRALLDYCLSAVASAE